MGIAQHWEYVEYHRTALFKMANVCYVNFTSILKQKKEEEDWEGIARGEGEYRVCDLGQMLQFLVPLLCMKIRGIAILRAVVRIKCDHLFKYLAEKGVIEADSVLPTSFRPHRDQAGS